MTHYVVLDIECSESPDDCLKCGKDMIAHTYATGDACLHYEKIGWSNKAALGLSIGCYYDSRDARTYFFDKMNLEETMQRWVNEQPCIVTFNGIQFDLPIMRGILRRRADSLRETALDHDDYNEGLALEKQSAALTALTDAFKMLCVESYDIFLQILRASPQSKFVKGLNSLDGIARANGLDGKTGSGAEAPRLWAMGAIASVVNYCAADVELTRRLFTQILEGQPIRRRDGTALLLPKPGGLL